MATDSKNTRLDKLDHGLYANSTFSVNNRALIVDDDEATLDLIQTALSRVGYQVDTASSGSKALEFFSQKEYDVVVSDWKMPEMDGLSLIGLLKKKSPYLGTILMTGYGTEESVIDAFTRGKINYYLSKPFELEELLETVSAAVRERKLMLSTRAFRDRLEQEIKRATGELEHKNALLEEKHAETENLYKELQANQAEIKGTKDYLENLIESSGDAIISTDRELRINLFSRGAEEMFLSKSDDYMGSHISKIFAQSREELDRIIDLLGDKSRLTHFEADINLAEGTRLYTTISVAVLQQKGETQGLLFIIKDITGRKDLEEKLRASNLVLEKLSITDGLTGLYNYRHFQERLTNEFQRALRFGNDLGLIMIDLDNFKLVNDTYGHQIGDKVLEKTADLIRHSIRIVDTPARYGGEEFAVILPQADLASTIQVAERIKTSLERFSRVQDIAAGLRITASIGLSGFPESDLKLPEDLIRLADQALYRAKQIGKNRIVVGRGTEFESLGTGERLTQTEKQVILRRVSQSLRTTLNLEDMLDYFIKEITGSLGSRHQRIPSSIMLMDEKRQLITKVEKNVNQKQRADFEYASAQVLEEQGIKTFLDEDKHGPVSSFPIIIDSPDGIEEVVGVMNVGVVPSDIDFIQDLVNQAALGIKNAKLYREMELSKASLERKVNELTYLALMGMTLQRNAQVLENFEDENRKLVTRCVTQIGFEKVLYFDYDTEKRLLSGGVDNSLQGKMKQDSFDISHLDESSRLLKTLTQMGKYSYVSAHSLVLDDELNPQDRQVLEAMQITSGEAGIVPTFEKGNVRGMLIAVKDSITPEDMEALSFFALHAGLIMDNLILSVMYRDKTQQITLLYDIGKKLSLATTSETREKATLETLESLTEVLQASEISLYNYASEDQTMKLLAFTSQTANVDEKPVDHVELSQSKVMGYVVRSTLEAGVAKPLVINEFSAFLDTKPKRRYITKSYIGIPMMVGEDLLGVMNITEKMNQTTFDPADLELATASANMLASALYNNNLFDRLEKRALNAYYQLIRGVESLEAGTETGHSERVASLAKGIAEASGLDKRDVELTFRSAFLHDIGKIGTGAKPDAVKNHPRLGAEMLGDWLGEVSPGILWHHEREDGQGCPDGLRGVKIPGMAKIIAVADRFDNLYLALKQGRRLNLSEALLQILDETGSHFDPNVVEALFRALIGKKLIVNKRPLGLRSNFMRRITEALSDKTGSKTSRRINDKVRKRFLSLLTELTP